MSGVFLHTTPALSYSSNDDHLPGYCFRAASLCQAFTYFGFEFKDISNIFIFVTTAIREIQITRAQFSGNQVDIDALQVYPKITLAPQLYHSEGR